MSLLQCIPLFVSAEGGNWLVQYGFMRLDFVFRNSILEETATQGMLTPSSRSKHNRFGHHTSAAGCSTLKEKMALRPQGELLFCIYFIFRVVAPIVAAA